MKRVDSAWPILIAVLGLIVPTVAKSEMLMSMSYVQLTNSASGGVLTMMKTPSSFVPYVAVDTVSGESYSSVLNHLAAEIETCTLCPELWGGTTADVEDDGLVLGGAPGCGEYIFGGTEVGLGIPPAPLALSVSYEPPQDKATLAWILPTNDYDAVSVVEGGIHLYYLAGNRTNFVHHRNGWRNSNSDTNDMWYCVVGCRKGIPSNGTGVRVQNGRTQESLMNVPFTRGCAPGCQKWSYGALDNIELEEGRREGVSPKVDLERSLRGKGFYQMLKGTNGFAGGIWRRFIDLRSGATFRVSARLNTLEMSNGDWNFSYHAAYNSTDGANLTSAQMAGVDPLPDGTNGKEAGRIASYNSADKTGGAWITRSTDQDGPGKQIGNLTIPTNGINSLTVWLRFEGTNVSSCRVGADSLCIEEIRRSE